MEMGFDREVYNAGPGHLHVAMAPCRPIGIADCQPSLRSLFFFFAYMKSCPVKKSL